MTSRCEDDLVAIDNPRERDALRDKFHRMRQALAEGQETIQSLTERVCYSLHSGHYRAATWYDPHRDVVWLLAVAIHRGDDERYDAYKVFETLEKAGRLYPTPEDVRRFDLAAGARQLADDIRALYRLKTHVLPMPNTGRHSTTTAGGLYAQVWVEAIGDAGLLVLRLRVCRLSGEYLDEEELGQIVGALFSVAVVETPDPDREGHLFRCFEEYIEVDHSATW